MIKKRSTPAKKAPAKPGTAKRPSTAREHPNKPGHWHVTKIATLCHLDRRRVEILCKEEEHFPKLESGWLDKERFLSCYIAYLQERSRGRPSTEANAASMEVHQERRRKIKRENDLAEGLVIEIKKVDELVMGLVTLLAQTLDGAAGRIAGGDAVLRQRLLNEHRRIRDNFANGLADFSTTVKSSSPDTPAPGPDAEPVGGSKKRTTKRKRRTRTV